MKKVYLIVLLAAISLNLLSQIHWIKHPDNPVMMPGAAGEWDEVIIAPGSVIHLNSAYHMWYWGGDIGKVNQRIGHATSSDGITWIKDVNNPVLEPGQDGTWDGTAVGDPTVIYNDSIFHMWYEGIPNSNLNTGIQIGHATSMDGINWTKDINNPVLKTGQSGEWDTRWVSQPAVEYNGSEYHMWYTGHNGVMEQVRIGHATSPDGVIWTKDPANPVLSYEPGKWDYPRVDFPKVIFDGNTYQMWYSGGRYLEWDIGYATSEDGSAWTKNTNNPVLLNGPAGTWDANFTCFSPVIDSAGVKYKMWYAGGSSINSSGIGYAESIRLVSIPDTAFLHALIDEGVDTNGDSLISYGEAETVTSLNVGRSLTNSGEISDMEGIEAFINLRELYCYHNSLNNLDVSNNSALEDLRCFFNQLTSLDASGCTALTNLDCTYNNLTSLDVSGCTALKTLDCGGHNLTSLDVSGCTALEDLGCGGNKLTSLDVSACTALTNLGCGDNQLTTLDVSGNTSLEALGCGGNKLTSLDVSVCTALTNLECGDNQLTTLDVSSNTSLEVLGCSNNQLISLDISGCTALTTMWCTNNQLTSLDVSSCTALTTLGCMDNQLISLDVSGCTALTTLWCTDNQLTSLDVSTCTALEYLHCYSNQLTSLDVSGCTALTRLWCSSNKLDSLDISNNTSVLSGGSMFTPGLSISNMPTLYKVCVWEMPFPPVGTNVDTTGSPNVFFTTECGSTGIEEPDFSELTIYPNPTSNLITIESDNPDQYSIEITTLNGQQILTSEMKGTSHQIDLSSFQTGVYFITVRLKDFVTTKKIIKL